MSNKSSKKDMQFNAEKEIAALKDEVRRIDSNIINQERNLKDVLRIKNQDRVEVFEDIKEFRETLNESALKVKKEIITYTLELISVIVGFLALVIAVVVLWVNRDGINNEMLPLYAALAAAFIVLFASFVGSWIFKNFLKVEGTEYKKIISRIDDNKSQMRDEIESNNSHLIGYIESNGSKMRDYADGKISKVIRYINSNDSKVRGYIKGEISKSNKYTNNKIIESHKYTDDKFTKCRKYSDKKIKDAVKSIKKTK